MHFGCNCGGMHYFELTFSDWDNWKEYWVEVVEPYTDNIWGRIKIAFKYIFKGQRIYHSGVGLTTADLIKVKEHIDKYIALDKPQENTENQIK